MRMIAFLIASVLGVQAHAFEFNSDNPPYAIREDFCKAAPIADQKADCKKYLLAPQDIAEIVDLTLECRWLQVLISERQEINDKKGEAEWRAEFDQKCQQVEWQRIQLLKKYWLRTDLSQEAKSEFMDALIRLPEALYEQRN